MKNNGIEWDLSVIKWDFMVIKLDFMVLGTSWDVKGCHLGCERSCFYIAMEAE